MIEQRGAPAVHAAPAPTTLSVVVCAYTLERWDGISAAIASLREQTRPVDEMVLVSDHEPELLERARAAFPDVLCLPNQDTRGLSGARNTGVRASTGDVVAFLDDDATAAPDWAARMFEAYADPRVAGVGGHVVPVWGAPRPAWFPDEFLWVVGCSYRGLPTERAEIRNPIGANMSFRRNVFDRIGGFDEAMGRFGKDAAGCEETEFAIRARAAQPATRIVLEPAAECRHTVSADRVTRRYFRRRCRAEGRSKALVSTLAGTEAALETERTYVRRTLPRGVRRELAAGNLSCAWAIVEGTALTAGSYAVARLRTRRRRP